MRITCEMKHAREVKEGDEVWFGGDYEFQKVTKVDEPDDSGAMGLESDQCSFEFDAETNVLVKSVQ